MHPTHHPAAEHPGSAQILRDAATYLTRYGWIQGTMYAPSLGIMPAACASGAIRAAVTGLPLPALTDCEDVDQVHAIVAAEVDLGEYLLIFDHTTGDELPVIAWWNDDPTTTGADVIDVLHAAADHLTTVTINLALHSVPSAAMSAGDGVE